MFYVIDRRASGELKPKMRVHWITRACDFFFFFFFPSELTERNQTIEAS